MNWFQIYAFYILPVAIGVGGWLYAQYYVRHEKERRNHAR